MSGLLYVTFVRCRGYILAALIVCAAASVAAAVLPLIFPNAEVLTSFITFVLSVILCVIIEEGLSKSLENNIKCRFMDTALAGGISAGTAALSELAANLIAVAAGTVLACIVQTVSAIAAEKSLSADMLLLWLGVSAVFGLISWIITPLTVVFKSQEKASLVVGLGVGTLAGFTMVANMNNPESIANDFLEFVSTPAGTLCFFGTTALIYAVVYVFLWLRLKRGDVC